MSNRTRFLAARAASALAAFLCIIAAIKPAFGQYGAANEDDGSATLIALLIVWLIGLAIYFIPTFVAFGRTHPNRWAIFVVNFAFGATGLGWLGSLVWAFNAVHHSPTGSDGGESGLNLFVNDPKTVRLGDTLPPVPEDDLTEKLQRLKRLFDSGALDADEYALMRKPIMERLLS